MQVYFLLRLSKVACSVVSGNDLFRVSGRKRQKKALRSDSMEKIMKGVLKSPTVLLITLSCGAQTPPSLALATLMPTPVLRIEVGYNSAV